MEYILEWCLLLVCLSVRRTKGELFDYSSASEWKFKFPECGGRRQSPIALKYSEVVHRNIPPLIFKNYDVPVSGHIKAINNGHTLQIDIPKTDDEHVPSTYGGGLNNAYKVKGFHFHWGSAGMPGSEHSIDGIKYDLELHIVHMKIPYHSLNEARNDPGGILVLGVLFEGVKDNSVGNTSLDDFYVALPHLTKYDSFFELDLMTMNQFLGELNTDEFFMYKGSLTTPPCSESAVWFVFPHILPIQQRFLERFWNLDDSKNELLLHNHRPMQSTNCRSVFYRSKYVNNKKTQKIACKDGV